MQLQITGIVLAASCLIALALLAGCSRRRSESPRIVEPAQPTVQVEFVNRSDNSILGTSNVPVDQLPESFRVTTSLDLMGRKWSVDSAEPSDKVDFVKTGKLRVVLAELLTMPSSTEIFYSLPTISDDCGVSAGDVLPNDHLFQIHEDDWRQIEFLSDSNSEAMVQEIKDVQAICDNQRKGVGFEQVHIRKRVPAPLAQANLSVPTLKSYFPVESDFEAVSFLKTRGSIPGSFAWATSFGGVIWGIADPQGNIVVLCLLPDRGNADQLAEAISKFTAENDLVFVDWCRRTAISGNGEAVRKYLEAGN